MLCCVFKYIFFYVFSMVLIIFLITENVSVSVARPTLITVGSGCPPLMICISVTVEETVTDDTHHPLLMIPIISNTKLVTAAPTVTDAIFRPSLIAFL